MERARADIAQLGQRADLIAAFGQHREKIALGHRIAVGVALAAVEQLGRAINRELEAGFGQVAWGGHRAMLNKPSCPRITGDFAGGFCQLSRMAGSSIRRASSMLVIQNNSLAPSFPRRESSKTIASHNRLPAPVNSFHVAPPVFESGAVIALQAKSFLLISLRASMLPAPRFAAPTP